ncbi:MAG TPA: hypothetical protein VFB96_17680 [Pirellulaceae bacterium]|nr:hypothetical protein [Pirellulaceae bacterium]
MLAEATIAKLDQNLLIMRIIHVSLALGVLGFAIVSLSLAGGEFEPIVESVDWIMAGFGLMTAIAGFVVPRLIPLPAPRDGLEEVSQAAVIAAGVQTKLIIGWAMFEGGAFANLTRYFTDHIALNLAVAGVLLLLLLLSFPRRSSLLDVVETRLRELREAKQLTVARQ